MSPLLYAYYKVISGKQEEGRSSGDRNRSLGDLRGHQSSAPNCDGRANGVADACSKRHCIATKGEDQNRTDQSWIKHVRVLMGGKSNGRDLGTVTPLCRERE